MFEGLRKSIVAVTVGAITLGGIVSEISPVLAATTYYSGAASTYAQNYALNYNTGYQSFNKDCANFVSQCLVAGGFCQSGAFKAYSSAWNLVVNQYAYLTANGYGTRVGQVSAKSNLLSYYSGLYAGDLVYYDWDGDGSLDHVAICSIYQATSSMPDNLVCAHTNDRKNVTWHLKSFMTDEIKQTAKETIVHINRTN